MKRGIHMLTKAELPECPVATTVQLIGSKWKLLIIQNLLERPLTDSLRSMEADGIITRTIYPEVPPRVEYSLSEVGETMRPIIKSLETWGTDYKQNLD
jgi:DNA-binding HxlR family transcriptional regulator